MSIVFLQLCHAIYLNSLPSLSFPLPFLYSLFSFFPPSLSSPPPSLQLLFSLPLPLPPSPLHPIEAEGLESSESSFEEELPPVSKPKLQTRHSMLDNLDEHINKQQTADEPPAKRIKREEENEVCESACDTVEWRGREE